MTIRSAWLSCLLHLFTSRALAQAAAPVPAAPASSLQISGYVQAQYMHSQESKGGLKDATTPNNVDKFEIRRGRLKLLYTKGITELVLQIDATQSAVGLRDAEASLLGSLREGVTGKVTVGLFKLPYSYDAQFSSNKRWFPERSQLAQRFFPGERDLGARLSGEVKQLGFSYALAVVNGQTIGEKAFPGLDPNREKDGLMHLGFARGAFSGGIAGYYGTGYVAPVEDDATTPEDESHGEVDYPRWSFGPDLRVTFAVPKLGAFDGYGELAYARNMARGKLADLPAVQRDASGQSQGRVDDRDQLAWYVALTQMLGPWAGVGLRVEQFTLDLEDRKTKTTIVEPVALGAPSEDLRLTFSYARRLEDADLDNDQLWVRLQAKYAWP